MKRNNKKLNPKDPRYMTKEQEQIVNLIRVLMDMN